MPAEGIDRIGLGGEAANGLGSDLRVLEHGLGLCVLCPAPAPDNDHAAKGKDCPALATEGFASRADFAVSEAEEPRHDEGSEKQRPQDGLGDEDEAAPMPARDERKKNGRTP